jgi:hypothetical protein
LPFERFIGSVVPEFDDAAGDRVADARDRTQLRAADHLMSGMTKVRKLSAARK